MARGRMHRPPEHIPIRKPQGHKVMISIRVQSEITFFVVVNEFIAIEYLRVMIN